MNLIQTIFEKTGCLFTNESRLKDALTHDSRGEEGREFERYEFLGDACVDLFLAEELVMTTNLAEGEMSQLRSKLTCNHSLASELKKLDLLPHLRLGKSMNAKQPPESVLADMFESLVGAVYVDVGKEAAQEFVLRVFRPRIKRLVKSGAPLGNPKSRLQEYFMTRGMSLPKYIREKQRGPSHAPLFTIRLELADGTELVVEAGSIADAERNLAEQALKKLLP